MLREKTTLKFINITLKITPAVVDLNKYHTKLSSENDQGVLDTLNKNFSRFTQLKT